MLIPISCILTDAKTIGRFVPASVTVPEMLSVFSWAVDENTAPATNKMLIISTLTVFLVIMFVFIVWLFYTFL